MPNSTERSGTSNRSDQVGETSRAKDADPATASAIVPGPQNEVIFLGTGTSVGVPAIGCECAVCQSEDPRNNRTRCAIVLRIGEHNLLVDTPPDLRTQLLRERIPLIHAVVFTHEHADHLFGLDDLRLFPFRLGTAVPLYCQSQVEDRIRKAFDYAFENRKSTHPGATPRLEFKRIDEDSFDVLGTTWTPIPMKHGPRFTTLGFRIGDFAYCTDTSEISEDSLERLSGLDTFVVDALRHEPHPTHFNIKQALEVVDRLQPRRTLLTHISHELDYATTNAELPSHVELAYDGLRVPLVLPAD